MDRINYKTSVFLLIVVIEILSLLILTSYVNLATIIYVAAGIAISILPLYIEGNNEKGRAHVRKSSRLFSYIIYMALILLMCNWVLNVFRLYVGTTHLNKDIADTLLFIKEMAQRYLNDKPVYDPISSIWGMPVNVVYLPGFWFPYAIPLFFKIDIRWASLVCFIASVLIVSMVRKKTFSNSFFGILIPLAIFIYMILGEGSLYLMYTQEGVVLLYVTLLAYTLINDYWIAAGIAAALCMMSRYFIAPPLFAAIIWLYFSDPKAARKTALAALCSLAILLTITHTWGDIAFFFKIPGLYFNMLNNNDNFNVNNYVYYKSVGFASFFKHGQVNILTSINAAIIFIVPSCFFLYLYKAPVQRSRGLVILCGIKLFLVLFLTTLSIPFGSVLYTSSMVSIVLLRSMLGDHSALQAQRS